MSLGNTFLNEPDSLTSIKDGIMCNIYISIQMTKMLNENMLKYRLSIHDVIIL